MENTKKNIRLFEKINGRLRWSGVKITRKRRRNRCETIKLYDVSTRRVFHRRNNRLANTNATAAVPTLDKYYLVVSHTEARA